MPVKSYLAHPQQGMKSKLAEELSAIDHCEVIIAENKNLIVLVTDTNNNLEEELLKEKLDSIDSLELLAMVSGFNSPKNK